MRSASFERDQARKQLPSLPRSERGSIWKIRHGTKRWGEKEVKGGQKGVRTKANQRHTRERKGKANAR